MKLRILVKIIEKLLGMEHRGEESRADMYLPERLLAIAIVFIAGGIALGLYAVFRFAVWAVVLAVLGLGFGICALLCWKNQAIHMISDTQFTYTTMFGNTRTYYFGQIQGLRRNKDSLTLFVAGQKVHIESMAFISERLVDAINNALERKQ